MTKLEAVNRVLRAVGDFPAAVLDTGGTSGVAQAEAALDAYQDDLLATGWFFNTDDDVTLYPPDRSIVVAGGAGTFLAGETVTEAITLATGQFYQIVGGSMQLLRLTGTFTGAQVLTGATSGATRNGAALTAITSGEIVLHRDTLSIAAWEGMTPFSVRAGKLYDTTNKTLTWSASVRVNRILRFTFLECQPLLQAYITAFAAVEFQRQIQGSGKIDQFALDELAAAKAKWCAQDTNESQASFINDYRSLGIRGISWMPVERRL